MSRVEFSGLPSIVYGDSTIDLIEIILLYDPTLLLPPMALAQQIAGKLLFDIADGKVASTETARLRAQTLSKEAMSFFFDA